jgi:hypothetical protein
MAQFEATIRIYDVAEADPVAARRAIEERLRTSGFNRWQIANLGVQGAIPTRVATPSRRRRVGAQASYAGGGMLVAAVVAWTLWFLWMLAG